LRLHGTTDDIGIDFRTTFKALFRFGTPPQRFWPYSTDRFHSLPADPFLFGFARDFEGLRYFRLDSENSARSRGRRVAESDATLLVLKSCLVAELPFVFGFPVETTLARNGLIGTSDRAHRVRGGQAVVAVGFDDDVRVGSQRGALLVRSSWGSHWGDKGYGWFPYDCVRSSLCHEFWSVTRSSKAHPAS
jgi:hypothetical protein